MAAASGILPGRMPIPSPESAPQPSETNRPPDATDDPRTGVRGRTTRATEDAGALRDSLDKRRPIRVIAPRGATITPAEEETVMRLARTLLAGSAPGGAEARVGPQENGARRVTLVTADAVQRPLGTFVLRGGAADQVVMAGAGEAPAPGPETGTGEESLPAASDRGRRILALIDERERPAPGATLRIRISPLPGAGYDVSVEDASTGRRIWSNAVTAPQPPFVPDAR